MKSLWSKDEAERPAFLPVLQYFRFALVGLFLACLFAIALAGQSLLHAHLLAWLHVVRVPLDFFNNVFLLYLALETAQCILQRFAFLNLYFCQMRLHLPTLRLDTL
jgi:hypothetical protein